MGRQYNFYISPEQDLKFIKYLFEEGYKIVVPHAFIVDNDIRYDYTFDKIEIYQDINSFLSIQEQHFYSVEIYKGEWGGLVKKECERIDYEKSPIIEYNRCFIHEYKNFLSRGRLYIRTYYKNEIEYFDTVYKEYQKLVRVMKKNIDYKDYEFDDGRHLSWPASQEAIDILKSGCKIGM